MKFKSILAGFAGVVIVAGAAAFAYAWHGSIDPINPPDPASFDPGLVAKGAELAAVGNCTACHTKPGNPSFSGGLALPTPFGTIYSTNITPDPETGIGTWSPAAFQRAMREGVRRDGAHLYPAFPFDHFTLVSDADDQALYAYLMTRRPVKQVAPDNKLPFPLDIRMAVAGWKLLFFDQGAYQNKDSETAEWNRGAYLANGLGHCGACHTPRNGLGAEKSDKHFAGGEQEGWTAFALDGSSPAPVAWNADSLYAYLRQGWHEDHGLANGPMAEVTGNLGRLPDQDVHAIATYISSLMPQAASGTLASGDDIRKRSQTAGLTLASASTADTSTPRGRGETIYRAACSVCHDSGRPLPFGGVDLHLSSTIHAPDAQNAINTVLFGLPATSGRQSAIMPNFAPTMTDAQLSDLLAYLRQDVAQKPAWDDVASRAADTRSGKIKVSVRPSDGIERGPDNIGAQDK